MTFRWLFRQSRMLDDIREALQDGEEHSVIMIMYIIEANCGAKPPYWRVFSGLYELEHRHEVSSRWSDEPLTAERGFHRKRLYRLDTIVGKE